MDERDCLILQYIFEEQNFTKAAERLYITPPALTYRIQQMETDFGVRIIEKRGKHIEFTPEGEYLVSRARRQLLELDKVKDYILNMSGEVQGKLKIGVSRVFAYYKLPFILRDFINVFPRVEMNLTTGFSYDIHKLLENEDIHLGIVRGNYKWPEHKQLIKEENICIVSSDKICVDDLPELPRIYYNHSRLSNALINYWWYERFNVPPLITMNIDNYEVCKEMVKCALGYAIIPEAFFNPEDKLYSIDLVRKNGKKIKVSTWLMYKKSSLQLTIVDKFVNYIKSLDI